MSVSNPLLKSLKEIVKKLCLKKVESDSELSANEVNKDVVTDSNEHLQNLCECLEEILRKGLFRVGGMIMLETKDYWNWFNDLPKLIKQHNNNAYSSNQIIINGKYDTCLGLVKKYSDKVDTSQSKGRLMIRCLLQYKILCWPFQQLCLNLDRSAAMGGVTRYYSDLNSLLANEILSEILISQLQPLSHLNIQLNLVNCLFLNDTWIIPGYETYQFVPCKKLGVNLVSLGGCQIVESVNRGSVAEDQHNMTPGDVLDTLFTHTLKNMTRPLKDIMLANQNTPVTIGVIKCRLGNNGKVFPPIYQLLRKYEMMHIIRAVATDGVEDAQMFSSKPALLSDGTVASVTDQSNQFPSDCPAGSAYGTMQPLYGLRYVGSTYIGSYGGVTKIEGSIAETLRHYNDPSKYSPVYMELGEKDVVIYKTAAGSNGPSLQEDGGLQVLFGHAYPQISSCGRRIDCTRFLAYIVGESTCTISKHFVCHVFEARSDSSSKSILTSIAQGFDRTHWTI